jgi:hypothetical protein
MFPDLLNTGMSAQRPELAEGTEYLKESHCVDFLSH